MIQRTKCDFMGCYEYGHLKYIHLARRSDTIQRLKDKYGKKFEFGNRYEYDWDDRNPKRSTYDAYKPNAPRDTKYARRDQPY